MFQYRSSFGVVTNCSAVLTSVLVHIQRYCDADSSFCHFENATLSEADRVELHIYVQCMN